MIALNVKESLFLNQPYFDRFQIHLLTSIQNILATPNQTENSQNKYEERPKATLALSLFSVTFQKKTVIVLFPYRQLGFGCISYCGRTHRMPGEIPL